MPVLIVVLTVVAADQATKHVARTSFGVGESVHVAGAFWIHLVYNQGISGGGLNGAALPVTILGLISVAAIFAFLAHQRALRPIVLLGFALLVGGGLGNLIDRARFGHVTDFIRRGGGVFNVADVAVYVGGAIVFIALIVLLAQLLTRSDRGVPSRTPTSSVSRDGPDAGLDARPAPSYAAPLATQEDVRGSDGPSSVTDLTFPASHARTTDGAAAPTLAPWPADT